jgi:hypothetical protein
MGLPIGERRRLRRIERAITRTDPRLDALYAMFTRLGIWEAPPQAERVRAWRIRRAALVRRGALMSSTADYRRDL